MEKSQLFSRNVAPYGLDNKEERKKEEKSIVNGRKWTVVRSTEGAER